MAKREVPMKIDISPLLRAEATKLDFSFDLDAPEDFAGAHFENSIKISGVVNNQAGYMTLDATALLDYSTCCARCMTDISGTFELKLEKPIALRGSLQNEDSDDYVIVENGKIDIDELLEESVVMDFPMRFLCKEDCKGLCFKCGKDLNFGDCDCPKKEIDPRLAKLSKLLDK